MVWLKKEISQTFEHGESFGLPAPKPKAQTIVIYTHNNIQ